MRTGGSLSGIDDSTDFDPEAELRTLSTQIARLIGVAQALVTSQRHVDVVGLQDQVGLLCAKALDLPPSQTGFVKLELRQLASAIDTLSASLRANAA